jgi:hypothetical protein
VSKTFIGLVLDEVKPAATVGSKIANAMMLESETESF